MGTPACKDEFSFDCWNITVCKSHILQSRCTSPSICEQSSNIASSEDVCNFCRYERVLKLPQIPEMTFPDNSLTIVHKEYGFGINFNCLGALLCVDNKNDLMKVAVAEAWQEARSENSHIKDVVKPFDWTFSTDYKGTLLDTENSLKIVETEEEIDSEKLKAKDKISFYNDVILFEDELADNGTAECSVKIRVMPDCLFVLMRYFLRLDNLFVRINDTRLYYEVDKKYMLREFTTKQSKVRDLHVPPSLFCNPQELWNYLPIVKTSHQKLLFPS